MPSPFQYRLIAIERDPVAAQQPVRILRLPLAEQLEIEIPDALNALHPVLRLVLSAHHFGELRGGEFGIRRDDRLRRALAQVEQAAAQRCHQRIDRLDVPVGGSRGSGAELGATERAQGGGMACNVDRLCPQPGTQHRLGRPATQPARAAACGRKRAGQVVSHQAFSRAVHGTNSLRRELTATAAHAAARHAGAAGGTGPPLQTRKPPQMRGGVVGCDGGRM